MGCSCPRGGVLQARVDKMEDQMKMNFDNFQIQKWMLQTVKAEKVDQTMGHLSSFHLFFFPCFLLHGPWVVQKSAFLQFCADVNKKHKSVQPIYSFENSHFTLSENDVVFRGLSHHLCNISNKYK